MIFETSEGRFLLMPQKAALLWLGFVVVTDPDDFGKPHDYWRDQGGEPVRTEIRNTVDDPIVVEICRRWWNDEYADGQIEIPESVTGWSKGKHGELIPLEKRTVRLKTT